jgi:hypothetical protein
MKKFSGYCYLTIENHNIIENEEYDILGEEDWISSEIDFEYDILPLIKKNNFFSDLKNGYYHIYFNGSVDFSSDYCPDYGCYESDAEFVLDYVNFQLLDEHLN